MVEQHDAREALEPCPFCGSGETTIVECGRQWLGTRYGEPASVSVRHHCVKVEGQPTRMIERVGKDRESAVAAWNRRATPPAAPAPEARGEDDQWTMDRAADLLEQYAEFIKRDTPERIEEHPYLPELELVAADLRKLAATQPAGPVLRPKTPTKEMVDAGQVHTMREDEEDSHRARGAAIACYMDMCAAAPTAPPAALTGAKARQDELELFAARWRQLEHMYSKGATADTLGHYIGRPERLDYTSRLRAEHDAAMKGKQATP